jgi:exonuclease VII large subunit
LPDLKVIRNCSEVTAGQKVSVRLAEGRLECLVEKAEKAEK